MAYILQKWTLFFQSASMAQRQYKVIIAVLISIKSFRYAKNPIREIKRDLNLISNNQTIGLVFIKREISAA